MSEFKSYEEVALTGLSDLQEQGRSDVPKMMLEYLVCTGRWAGCHVLSRGTRQRSMLEREDDGSSSKPVEFEDQNCSGYSCSLPADTER